MPPKAMYWHYFDRHINKATCNIGRCRTLTLSLGKEPEEGTKKTRMGICINKVLYFKV
jgi:hypothetical protein